DPAAGSGARTLRAPDASRAGRAVRRRVPPPRTPDRGARAGPAADLDGLSRLLRRDGRGRGGGDQGGYERAGDDPPRAGAAAPGARPAVARNPPACGPGPVAGRRRADPPIAARAPRRV